MEKEVTSNMDKIGILTFHYSNNYGGVLQAIALQNTLRDFKIIYL